MTWLCILGFPLLRQSQTGQKNSNADGIQASLHLLYGAAIHLNYDDTSQGLS
jgi:hypothetical protein